MKILVTGASGYIGARFINLALAHGHEVVAASRRPSGSLQWLHFDLKTPLLLTLPRDVDAVLHLAIDTDTTATNDTQYECAAAKILIEKAREIDATFVFVSSQTARDDAPTNYGRMKWWIEREVLVAKGRVVRPGQVYGGAESGLFGTLVRLVRNLPVLPAFIPAPLVQPIHVDDCVKGLLLIATEHNLPSRIYNLAAPTGISFTTFLRSIARQHIRCHKIYLPIPVPMFRIITELIGAKIHAQLGLSRLESLFDLRPMDTATDLELIGLKLRSLDSGMHRSGSDRRRRLILEGSSLLTYILRAKPHSSLVRRYVRAIEKLRLGIALSLPYPMHRWPTALSFLDAPSVRSSKIGTELAWRIDASTVIAEASKQGAIRFLGDRQQSRQLFTTLLRMAVVVCAELATRILRPILPLRYLTASKRSSEDG
jgi:uncharacterized protein YbjT (DUF2867 family)